MYIKKTIMYKAILDIIVQNKVVTQKQIAQKLNVSERTVRRYMQDLKKMGIITLVINGKNRVWEIS